MNITTFITIILAISVASERLIAVLKTIFPWLSGSQPPGKPLNPKNENIRQLVVMLISFSAAWVTSAFLGGTQFDLLKTVPIGDPAVHIPAVILGVLASGGSAFWTSLLGYTKAVKDIKTEQGVQEKLKTNDQLS